MNPVLRRIVVVASVAMAWRVGAVPSSAADDAVTATLLQVRHYEVLTLRDGHPARRLHGVRVRRRDQDVDRLLCLDRLALPVDEKHGELRRRLASAEQLWRCDVQLHAHGHPEIAARNGLDADARR